MLLNRILGFAAAAAALATSVQAGDIWGLKPGKPVLKSATTLAFGPEDILFVERWAEQYGIKFEHAIAAWWIGYHEESIQMFKELLQRDDLPDNYREACKRNLTNCGVTE